MVKLVYQCDHCSETHTERSVIEDHEERCFSNPESKMCGSCEHYDFDYHMTMQCAKKVKAFPEVELERISCSEWEECHG